MRHPVVSWQRNRSVGISESSVLFCVCLQRHPVTKCRVLYRRQVTLLLTQCVRWLVVSVMFSYWQAHLKLCRQFDGIQIDCLLSFGSVLNPKSYPNFESQVSMFFFLKSWKKTISFKMSYNVFSLIRSSQMIRCLFSDMHANCSRCAIVQQFSSRESSCWLL